VVDVVEPLDLALGLLVVGRQDLAMLQKLGLEVVYLGILRLEEK
jgi:hypothetical protein